MCTTYSLRVPSLNAIAGDLLESHPHGRHCITVSACRQESRYPSSSSEGNSYLPVFHRESRAIRFLVRRCSPPSVAALERLSGRLSRPLSGLINYHRLCVVFEQRTEMHAHGARSPLFNRKDNKKDDASFVHHDILNVKGDIERQCNVRRDHSIPHPAGQLNLSKLPKRYRPTVSISR